MHRRFRKRLKSAIGLGILIGAVFTAIDWMGYGGSFDSTAIPTPHSLGEIWWHFFVWAGLIFASMMLWPFRSIEDLT